MIDESTVMDVDVGGHGEKMDGVAEKKPFVQVRIAGFFYPFSTPFFGLIRVVGFLPFFNLFCRGGLDRHPCSCICRTCLAGSHLEQSSTRSRRLYFDKNLLLVVFD